MTSFPRKLHVEECKKCGGLCGNFGEDGWKCTACWAVCDGPDDWEGEEE